MKTTSEQLLKLKNEATQLFDSRHAMVIGDGAAAADGASLRYVNRRFRSIAKELGISEAALEFWIFPVGIMEEISQNTICSLPTGPAEEMILSLDQKLKRELLEAGLIQNKT